MKTLMEKEILEQPKVVSSIIERYIVDNKIKIDFPKGFKKIKFIASGSSYNCARMAEKFFRDILNYEASSEFSSEFLANKTNKINKDTLYFFISQSGKTKDTLAVLDYVKKEGAKSFALVNVQDSPMYEMADYKMVANAGVEMAVAATKSFVACVLCCYLIVISLSKNQTPYIKELIDLSQNIELVLEKNIDEVENCANFLAEFNGFPLIGYNYYYILCKEGSLKIKETSYKDTNAYALGEFIHGHVALLNKNKVLLEVFEKNMGEFEKLNLKKIVEKYNPKRVTISDFESELNGDYKIILPNSKGEFTKFIQTIVVLQLLALKIALKLELDVDKPNGLNKVVE